MSISGGIGGSKGMTTETSVADPWAPTQPLLKDIIGKLTGLAGGGDDGAAAGAADDLINYLKGNGGAVADKITSVGKNLIDTPDRTGEVTAAYDGLKGRLTDTADGKNLDLSKNTYLQGLLAQVGDDAQKRVNSTFAAAGRDLSPGNSIEVGKGVTQAQLPMLLDQFNREQGRTDAAARDLASGGVDAAGRKTSMDVARGGLLKDGASLTQAGLDSGAGSLEKILEVTGLKDKIPFEKLGWLTELLNPIAALGGQKEGTSTTKGSKWGLSGTAKIY